MSKHKHLSRKENYVETETLEKILISYCVKITRELIAHEVSGLKSCYDRQLTDPGVIVEESTWDNRDAIRMSTRALPVIENQVSVGYGLSKKFCGEKEIIIVGIELDNFVGS